MNSPIVNSPLGYSPNRGGPLSCPGQLKTTKAPCLHCFLVGHGIKWAKHSFFGWREPIWHLFCIENIDRWGSNWPPRTKMRNFDPKIWKFGAKIQFFVLESRFLSTVYFTLRAGAITFPFGPPQKSFPFPSYGSFFGAHPCFWPFRAIPTLEV